MMGEYQLVIRRVRQHRERRKRAEREMRCRYHQFNRGEIEERENTQRPPGIEVSEVMRLGLLLEKDRRDQITAQDEEDVDADPAVRQRVTDAPRDEPLFWGDDAVQQDDHHDGDGTDAVELWEIR